MGFSLPDGTLPPPPPPPQVWLTPEVNTNYKSLNLSTSNVKLKSVQHSKHNLYRCYILNFANPNYKQIAVTVNSIKNCYLWSKSFTKGDVFKFHISALKSKSMYLFIPYPKNKANIPENYINWTATDTPCCTLMSYVEIVRKSGFIPPHL